MTFTSLHDHARSGGQLINEHESNFVPGPFVFSARIAESNNQVHRRLPIADCRLPIEIFRSPTPWPKRVCTSYNQSAISIRKSATPLLLLFLARAFFAFLLALADD